MTSVKLYIFSSYIATMASAEVPVETIMYELGKSPQYGEIAKEARAIIPEKCQCYFHVPRYLWYTGYILDNCSSGT